MLLYDKKPMKTGGTSIYPYSPELESLFVFKPKYSDEISMAVRVGNTLHVPRECVPLGEEDHRVYKTPIAINCKKPPRTEEQAEVIAKSVQLLQDGYNHVFDAPTGFGKSYCGAAIACAIGQPTLIIVTKEDLLDSWKDCLINLVGIPEHEIGHVQQDVCKYKGLRFVIAMIHSLVKEDKYDSEFRNYFGMVIFDECHHLGAEGFVKSCQMFPAALRLGLSATPTRGDGKWQLIEAHIGPVRVRGNTVPMKPKVLVKKTGWRIPLVPRWIDDPVSGGKTKKMVPIPHSPGRMMSVIKAMAEDYPRNAMIVEFVVAAYKAQRTVVVMSELVEGHLKPLFHLLAAHIPAEDIDYYIGGRSKLQLTIAKTKPVVLATYQMCGEGTDVPSWDSMCLTTPRANVKQAIGRIMRIQEGKKEPVCLDLVDADQIFGGFYLSRERQYFEVKATIVKM